MSWCLYHWMETRTAARLDRHSSESISARKKKDGGLSWLSNYRWLSIRNSFEKPRFSGPFYLLIMPSSSPVSLTLMYFYSLEFCSKTFKSFKFSLSDLIHSNIFILTRLLPSKLTASLYYKLLKTIRAMSEPMAW